MDTRLGLLFWFLLLLHQRPSMSSPILKYGCRPGTLQECKDARFVPGHTLLGEGIDIVTMKATGSFLFDLQEVDKRCTVCENPHNQNALQKLPKGMVDWRPESTCFRNMQSSVSQTKVSVANDATTTVQNDWKVGLSVKAFAVDASVAVGGSHSKMAQFADDKSRTDNYNFLSHKLECSVYSFGLGTNASLSHHFQKHLSELPDNYTTTTKETYRRLISKFGTHYITSVKAGGRSQEVTAVRKCQLAMNGLHIDEVKDCLSVEAEVGVSDLTKSASLKSKYENCKNKMNKMQHGGDFHRQFNERVLEVTGGNIAFDLLSTEKGSEDAYNKWLESLKSHPGLVSYSLDSIHNLVKGIGPKKENLRLAVSEYINEMALIQKCSCPGGHVGKHNGDCSCSCKASRYTSPSCCPTKPGAAKLHVSIYRGNNLYGDVSTETDAYVTFRYDTASMRTRTIDNKNNPQWNEKFDLGEVVLSDGKKYTIEVWDEDKSQDDNLLGKCEKVLNSGVTPDTCYLNHGSITYSVTVICANYLQGIFCQDYFPEPPSV